MIGSLYSGISGLNAQTTALEVIGDNIANVKTTGFKANTTLFSSVLSQSLTGASGNEIGRGTQVWDISRVWNQGTLENTDNGTDLSINGAGFFVVTDESGVDRYTRAGAFKFDENGNLVNPDGYYVQGYQYDSVTGTYSNDPTNITISGSTSPPVSTTEITTTLNLNADAAVGDTFSTTITVYDSLGSTIPLTLTYAKTGAGTWTWTASVPAAYGQVVAASGTGTLAFLSNGELDPANCVPASGVPSIEISGDGNTGTTLLNGADPVVLDWTYLTAAGLTDGSITQYSAASTTTFQTQNGYAAGDIASVSVDEEGIITGAFTNGEITPLYRITLANFPNLNGLRSVGGNLYEETRASGSVSLGNAKEGGLGPVIPNTLEMSNVDLATEFVNMITTQRAFQANSKVITTSDEILAELISLKR